MIKIDKNYLFYKHLSIPSSELRISIVAGCNMKCSYCHNEGQGEFSQKRLAIKDIEEIIILGKQFGITKIRLTGGEPFIHPDIFEIIELIKVKYKIINFGINTNGTLLTKETIIKLKEIEINNIVIGFDYFNSSISKNSYKGKSSEQIKDVIYSIKDIGLNVQVASVYLNKDIENLINIVEWCITNNILIKILELVDESIVNSINVDFINMIEVITKKFSLTLGKTVATNEIYGIHHSGSRVLFFHSHCKVRECHECSLMHMRITSSGNAKPCILRNDTEFKILGGNGYQNMLKAIHNLGNPPENLVK